MTVHLAIDSRFCDHDTGPTHPERPPRLRAILARLDSSGLAARLPSLVFEPAGAESIDAVHDRAYVDRLDAACRGGLPFIDAPDSTICPASAQVARLAAGAGLAAVDAVVDGEAGSVFCAVRPPGHHAESDRSMGFCLLNNIAMAAERARSRHGLQRVAIVDFDVHHGNGTQHIFEERSDVLFVSLHEDPSCLYPGTGFAAETGRGEGKGFTLNLPMPPGGGDAQYREAFERRVLPRLEDHRPQLLLVSAGFDAAEADPLAHMAVTPAGFEWMTQQLAAVAGRHCDGRLVSFLEGGYDLESLADCVERHVEALDAGPSVGGGGG